MTYAGYVLRHLAARPLRATLTAGAFAFSIGLLGFLWLLAAALQKEWSPYMAQRVMVTAKTSFFDKLPMAYLAKIEATPGVVRAVLRVLGFRRRAIAGFLLGEALVYGLAGALLGGAVMATFAHFVGAALDKTQYAGMGGLLVPDATALLLAAALSIALAVAAGAAPALNLARRPIAELLRES